VLLLLSKSKARFDWSGIVIFKIGRMTISPNEKPVAVVRDYGARFYFQISIVAFRTACDRAKGGRKAISHRRQQKFHGSPAPSRPLESGATEK